MKLLDFYAESVQYFNARNDPVTDSDGYEYDNDLFGGSYDHS